MINFAELTSKILHKFILLIFFLLKITEGTLVSPFSFHKVNKLELLSCITLTLTTLFNLIFELTVEGEDDSEIYYFFLFCLLTFFNLFFLFNWIIMYIPEQISDIVSKLEDIKKIIKQNLNKYIPSCLKNKKKDKKEL